MGLFKDNTTDTQASKQAVVQEDVAGVATLESFLAPNIEAVKPVTKKISDRLPPFTVKAIPAAQASEIRKKHTKTTKAPGKGNGFIQSTDGEGNMLDMIIACTVVPDFNSAELQKSYGVMGAQSLVGTMLLPGEHADLSALVAEVNGFDSEMQEEIEKAKN